jgi:O-antigen/teichoic acid export membrane protein
MDIKIQNDNKKILKNTFFLYIRQIIVLFINFYSFRILYKALGESDYGIYNVIAGVIILFSFLNIAVLLYFGVQPYYYSCHSLLTLYELTYVKLFQIVKLRSFLFHEKLY